MKRAVLFLIVAVALIAGPVGAQTNESAPLPGSYNGISWGFARTWWSANKYAEGYADAGTAGPMLSLRKVRPMGSSMAMALYLNYLWMRSNTSVLRCDTCYNELVRTRAIFREIDLGLNLMAYLNPGRTVYLGGGPSIRWGHSAKRFDGNGTPDEVRKAAWFGVTVLGGMQHGFGDRMVVFVEPQFTFSPDPSDLWQKNYPPANWNMMMGVLWR